VWQITLQKTGYGFSDGGAGGPAGDPDCPLVGAGGRTLGAVRRALGQFVEDRVLAKRNSRSTFPTARITSGIRSGPITIRATARISIISSGFSFDDRPVRSPFQLKGLPFDPENSARLLHVSQSYASECHIRSGVSTMLKTPLSATAAT